MIVVLGTQAGCLASTVNPFATGIASGIAGISAGDGMGMRVLMLVVFTGLVIFIINRYADKVKAHPEKSVQFFRRKLDLIEFPVSADENLELSGRQKGVLAIFVLTFAIMVVGCVPWTSINLIGRSSSSSCRGSRHAGAARGAGQRHHAVRFVVLPRDRHARDGDDVARGHRHALQGR